MFTLNNWVERKFKIDDAVSAVAIHGYAGFFGVCVAGFVLWGYPTSPNPEYAVITPWGQFLGAMIMFWVLGFFPAFIAAKILHKLGLLRIPKEIELLGLDVSFAISAEQALREIEAVEKQEFESLQSIKNKG